MFKISKLSTENLDQLFRLYEYRFGLRKEIVEKDFRVTFLLYFLFNASTFHDYFIFKGGTSLSKCYNLISRFSEDIDLILKWHYITDESPDLTRSKTKQNEYNKKINKETEEFLNEKFITILKEELEKAFDFNILIQADPENSQVVNFYYPKLYNDSKTSILQYIKLEIGTLGALTPTEIVPIKPLIANLNFPELNSLETSVVTVTATRTFWEKITILHHEANRPKESEMPLRYSRHYYDVYSIGHSAIKEKAFNDLDLLKNVVSYKEKFYPRNWAKYGEAFPPTLKLIPPSYRFNSLKKDYIDMQEMIYNNPPSFEELIAYLKKLEDEINALV